MLSRLLPWPLPALLSWLGAWILFTQLQRWMVPTPALLAACAFGVLASVLGNNWWRRALIAVGFPLALALSGALAFAPWAWLLPLGALLLVYPLHAWRDAPLFPTSEGALLHLPAHAPLEPGAAVLDAGCGLGHGLWALAQAYPLARIHGIERSRLLHALCARRCPWASVQRGDMWQAHWGAYQLVYLFQRPESMARAAAKAQAEMAPGSWLVSLDFAIPAVQPSARLRTAGGRMLWIYRLPLRSAQAGADTMPAPENS